MYAWCNKEKYLVLKLNNFAAANSSMEQLLLFFILTCTNHLALGLFLFSSEFLFSSGCLFLNNYLNSKDLISDKNKAQNFGLAKSQAC